MAIIRITKKKIVGCRVRRRKMMHSEIRTIVLFVLFLVFQMANNSHFVIVENGMTEEQVKDPSKPEEGEAVRQFFAWLAGRESLVLAGHNPMFDLSFLQAAAARHHVDFPIAHRSLDLHTICYVHMVQKGEIVPIKNKKSDLNSDAVMKYVGIPSEPKPHIAINGAVWEAEALSRLIFNKNLLEQFAQYPIPWV
jgi:DNA polymerase III epsilon subunit-like protein